MAAVRVGACLLGLRHSGVHGAELEMEERLPSGDAFCCDVDSEDDDGGLVEDLTAALAVGDIVVRNNPEGHAVMKRFQLVARMGLVVARDLGAARVASLRDDCACDQRVAEVGEGSLPRR